MYWYNLEATCGGPEGRGRVLDNRPSQRGQDAADLDIEEVAGEPCHHVHQEENPHESGHKVDFPQLQYSSSGAICWESEIVMDNQLIPWTEENSTASERELVSRCENARVNPLVL